MYKVITLKLIKSKEMRVSAKLKLGINAFNYIRKKKNL